MQETTGIVGQLERYCAGLGTILSPDLAPPTYWERGCGSAADGAALMSRGSHAQVRKASIARILARSKPRKSKKSVGRKVMPRRPAASTSASRQENRTSGFESIAGDCAVAFAIRRNDRCNNAAHRMAAAFGARVSRRRCPKEAWDSIWSRKQEKAAASIGSRSTRGYGCRQHKACGLIRCDALKGCEPSDGLAGG